MIQNRQIRPSIKLQCPKCFTSSSRQKLPRMMLVTPKALLPLLLLALPALAEEGIFDCLTGPCVTVEGVGKIQGSWQKTQWTNRRIYQFMGIPFGETTGGEHRSFACPPPHPFAKRCSIGLSLYFAAMRVFSKGLVHHDGRVL